MSENIALRLWQALEALGGTLATAAPQNRITGKAVARRLLEHPALQPWRDDPLKRLGDVYPSLDALDEALATLPVESSEETGTIWGALYLPAEGCAVAVRVRAVYLEGQRLPPLPARPLSSELQRSAEAAHAALNSLEGDPEDAGFLCYDIEAEGVDSALATAATGESLGLALVLAFWSARTGQPLPETLGATGAVHGTNIGHVGWIEEKRSALARRGVRLLSPVEIPTVRAALEAIAPASTATGLPAELTPLVGREAELDTLTELLRSGQTRLLTLVGFGGVGKTRLAIEVAHRTMAAFPGGAWFVSLEETHNETDVRAAISAALGTSSDSLELHLSGRRTLLVLDNFETALATTPAIGRLLRGLPKLHCLVTSRVALHIRGERRFDLDGLLPDDSMALFHARTIDIGVSVTPSQQSLVRAICRRLDGLPLALELAAARLKHLSLSELLERLEDALSFLTTRSRDVPERHRTVRATLEWSISLLEPQEKQLLRALSVFEGSFTARAAGAVSGTDALDGLGLLEEASLLRVERGPRETRFRLRVLVKELATELCAEAGETALRQEAHDTYFIQQALDAWTVRSDDVVRYDALEQDIESFRNAFRRRRAAPMPFPSTSIACLTRFLRRCGRWREMEEFLGYLRHRPRERIDALHAARLLLARASLERFRGKLPRAQRYAAAARNLATRTADPILQAELHVFQATLHARAGRAQEATDEIQQGLLLFERCSDSLGRIAALGNRAVLLYRSGELDAAADDFATLATLAGSLGSSRDEMLAHINRAEVLILARRWEEAEQAAWRGLTFAREHPPKATTALLNLGRAVQGRKPEAARPFLYGARELHRRFPLDDVSLAHLQEGLALLPESETVPESGTVQELLDPDYWRRIARQSPSG